MSAQELHEDAFVMDGLSASTLTDEYLTTTLPRAGVNAIQKTVSGSGDDFQTAVDNLILLQQQLERLSGVTQATSVEELRSGDEVKILFGFQDTTMFGDDVSLVRLFEQLGVRIIQLSYNRRNLSANGCTERVDDGLSDFGLEMIEAIETANIVVDLSHVGAKSAAEALEVATQPTVFSHSNPAGVYSHPRNISDELIEAAVATGGTVGINAYPDFVGANPTIADLIDHVEYLDDLVGVENVTLGLDFIDNRPDEELQSLIENPHYSNPPYEYPEGLGSAADIPNITSELVDRGFSVDEIRGVLGENLLRVYDSVWA